MATIDKSGVAGTTNLASTAAWTGGVIPTSADIARWLTTSLGPGLTGAMNVLGIEQQGATANIAHSAGTITLGASGFSQASTNVRIWVESSVWAVGTTDQAWSLASNVTGTSSLRLEAAAGLTGSAVITLQNNSGTTDPARAAPSIYGANTGFTGTIALATNAGLFIFQSNVLTASNIRIDGDGGAIMPASGTTPSFGNSSKTLTFNANGKMGYNGRSLTCNSTVAFGSTLRTVTLADDVTFAGPVTGTAGFSVAKSDSAWSRAIFSNASNTVTGPITFGDFIWALTPVSSFNFTDALAFTVDGIWRMASETTGVGFTAPHTFTNGTTFSGQGSIELIFAAANLITFPSGSLSGLTGTSDPGTTYAANTARSGLSLTTASSYTTGRQAYAAVYELPSRVCFQATPSTNTASTGRLYYIGAGATYAGTRIDMVLRSTTFPAQNINEIYANCSDANPLVIGGGVKRFGLSATQTLTLRGTSTADNEISGNIDGNSLGALGISKTDAGRWVLSGNNNHTGTNDVVQGTLSAQSTTALGASTGTVIIRSGATLEVNGGITILKGDADWEARSASGGIDSIGDNTIQCRNFALTEATTTFTVTTGNKLTIDPQLSGVTEGVITGVDLGITKAGAGELALAANANTFSGTLTASEGTLTVGSVGNAGVAAAWGQASSAVVVTATLKYSGATGSSNRAVQMTGSAPTLNASGTGPLTLSNITQDTTAKTMTLRGSNTAANTISGPIANNTGAVGIAKEDAGQWVLSGALTHTGATAVNNGTLRVETSNSNTSSSAVTVGATGTLELATDTLASSGGTAGRVLGTGAVVVNGTVKTRGGTTQKGQVRYGGNLTFGAGSSLYIGAAA